MDHRTVTGGLFRRKGHELSGPRGFDGEVGRDGFGNRIFNGEDHLAGGWAPVKAFHHKGVVSGFSMKGNGPEESGTECDYDEG